MSDAETLIRAESLSKVYRLYKKPHYRFLDMFGFLNKPDAYSEHQALANINLEIKRGEKVAFIGRNGAGKSTLLKLVTGVIRPSSGELQVTQGAHALLQIGSGFHQDFTGRQNVLAYLSHLGVSGKAASERLREIIAFAELEEYIDQPIKTYSTGMIARLMFSTSTAVAPDLLVLDEILGVGDAYFAHKSFERIREMCEGLGTTVLLVSHDIYSAAKLCERMIWIDSGQILFDGSAQEAIKAYETSIREQEEKRLRAKKFMSMTEGRLEAEAFEHFEVGEPLIVEVQASGPMKGPAFFKSLALTLPGEWEVEVPITAADAFEEGSDAYLLRDSSNWADALTTRHGHVCREMKVFGTPFNKVAALVRIPRLTKESENNLEFRCSYESGAGVPLKVSCFSSQGNLIFNGRLPETEGEWKNDYAIEKDASGLTVRSSNIGTNRVGVLDARFVDQAGKEIFLIPHGEPAKLLIEYKINDPELKEKSQVVVAFHRDGSVDVCRYISRDLFFDGEHLPTGIIEFSLTKFPLSAGRYTLTIMVAEQDYYDRQQTLYFTINPGVYSVRSKFMEFEVVGNTTLSAGTVFVGDGEWDIYSEKAAVGDECNLSEHPLPLRYILNRARKLADFKNITFCPGWAMGFDEYRGGKFSVMRKQIFESLANYGVIPPVCLQWVEDLKLALVLRGDISRALFVGGSYDPNELSVLKSLIKPGMTAIDVGANIGIYSTYLAKLVGNEGRVLAFEPSSRELANLERNIRINNFKHVSIHKMGLGSNSGRAKLNIADEEFGGHNSFKPLQSLPVIRVTQGDHPSQWITAWSGEREFERGSAQSMELYIYSESDFDYEIERLSVVGIDDPASTYSDDRRAEGVRETDSAERSSSEPILAPEIDAVRQLFPDWEVECSEGLRVELNGTLKVHGAGGDFIRFYVGPAAHDSRVKLTGRGVPRSDIAVEEVTVERLDGIVAAENPDTVDFIKLDIEGFEAEALEGAKETISRYQPLLLIEAAAYQFPLNFQKIREFLYKNNYIVYEIDPASGKLKKSKDIPISTNIFAVPAEKEHALEPVLSE